jgi:Major Facilitator Superfamily.
MRRYIAIIILFGIVSMLADITYEGARSVIPQYLGYLGADLAFVGFLGGMAEFSSYLLRFASGFIASRYGFLWGLTISGYALTGLSIALLSISTNWLYASTFTITERIAKGLRTPPRDALISRIAKQGRSGRAFGIHGALDQIGAIIGPSIAAYMLFTYYFSPILFFTLSIFAFISVIILLYTRSIYPKDIETTVKKISLGFLRGPITRYVVSVSLPAIGTVSIFIAIYWIGRLDPLLGIIYFIAIQFIQIIGSVLLGELYDKIGIKAIYVYYLIAPLITFGFLINQLFFLLIGVVLALEESIQRAIVGDMAKDKEAIAYGYYHLIYGLASATGGYLVGYLAQNSLIIQLTMLSIILSLVGALVFSTVRELNLDL